MFYTGNECPRNPLHPIPANAPRNWAGI
jgi:hypothetical protein